MRVVTRRKRVLHVNGREVNLGTMYLDDFICPKCLAAFEVEGKAWERVIQFYRDDYKAFSQLFEKEGIDNLLIKEVWNVVNTAIKYRYDTDLMRVADFWLLPNETWSMGVGDCEDTTFLLASVIEHIVKNPFEPSFKAEYYAVIGFYRDLNNNFYGHGYVIYRSKRIYDGWLWIETTFEDPMPQGVWLIWDPERLIPVYFFNKLNTYRIDRDYQVLGLSKDYVDRFRRYIDIMIDYVEMGKELTIKWMHKGRRVPETQKMICTV